MNVTKHVPSGGATYITILFYGSAVRHAALEIMTNGYDCFRCIIL